MQEPGNYRYLPHDSESGLWTSFLAGDEEALGNIFVRYYNRLFLYGMNLTESRSEVQDAIQELFLKLWKNRTTINSADSVEYYLINSLRRVIFKQKNKNSSINRLNRKYVEENVSFFATIEEQTIQREEKAERWQIFLKVRHNLSQRECEILYLRLQHGLINKEIASILDLSVQTVKNCLYEGTRKMREEISRIMIKNN